MLSIFTIAFNCGPDLRRQWEIIRRLSVPFHWSIVEGYAEPVGCTSWCKPLGPRWHDNGASTDNTRQAMFEIVDDGEGAVSAITRDGPWPGKLAMVNTALGPLRTPGVLVEIDADEFWTTEQLEKIPRLFGQFPEAAAAQFHCRLWMSPRHVVCSEHGYGSMPYEWFRAWRYDGSQRFTAHEPPRLEGAHQYIPRNVTRALGLVFDHRSYVRREQVALKEDYYGYAGAVAAWEQMCAAPFPAVDVSKFLPWVHGRCEAVVSA